MKKETIIIMFIIILFIVIFYFFGFLKFYVKMFVDLMLGYY